MPPYRRRHREKARGAHPAARAQILRHQVSQDMGNFRKVPGGKLLPVSAELCVDTNVFIREIILFKLAFVFYLS